MTCASRDKKNLESLLCRSMFSCREVFSVFLLALLSGFSLLPCEAAAVQKAVVQEISFVVDGPFEKVTIGLSRRTAYKANFLDQNPATNTPFRFYFDLANTAFAPGVKRRLNVQADCVRVVRSALNDPRTVRVVLEMNHKINDDDYKFIHRADPPALEVIFNIEKITTRAKKSAQPVVRVPVAPAPSPPKVEPAKPVAKLVAEPVAKPATEPATEPVAEPVAKPAAEPTAEPVAKPPEKPPAKIPEQARQPKPKGPWTYVIAVDAGHGGRDPGAIGHRGLKEKQVCLAVAKALKNAIDKRSGYRAFMTRNGDEFVSLEDRAKRAAEEKADILISIHGNSHADARIQGIETYYLNFSSDDDARKVAARENFTTPEKVGDLEMILFDLMQSEKTNVSSLLAGYVQGSIKDAVSSRHKNFRNLGVKHAPMRVLVEAEMPGILIETGFISNVKESARLQTTMYQKLLAEGIAEGVHDFFTSSKTAAYRKP